MILYLGIIAIQVACVVHLVKTGRNPLWLTALIFLPMVGAIAYFIVEILPGLQGNRHVRTVRAKASAALDPERELRAAREAVELTDTVANRVRLGDACADLGRWSEAEAAYREALAKAPDDARTQGKLARTIFEQGHAGEALALLDGLEPPAGQSERDRHGLLRARMLEHLGRNEEALALYADVATRLPGEEARCRYAALLLAEGWENKARKVLEEVEARAKRLDRQQRAAEAGMYRWAAETLTRLRAKAG
ncbi:tetratricopeptide repeat protein [Sphingomonas sp. MS122]|uniref:tetratricopeptide repeat protein n=1 Tax=Sphingomonas sp. MS122 TaxID=3412683 RepID=UPI003C2E4A22